jgi:hypothetical protein
MLPTVKASSFRPAFEPVWNSSDARMVCAQQLAKLQLLMAGAFVINTFSDQVLMFTPMKSDRGVLVFTNELKANAYIGERQLQPMHSLELTPTTVNLWIGKFRREGARFALIDAPPGGGTSGACRTSLDEIRAMVLQSHPHQPIPHFVPQSPAGKQIGKSDWSSGREN